MPTPEQRDAGVALFDQLREFQNVYHHTQWGQVRQVQNWNLLLVEKAIAITFNARVEPFDGYKLAAHYCQNYDPQYGNGLNRPSLEKIKAIRRWVLRIEAFEASRTA